MFRLPEADFGLPLSENLQGWIIRTITILIFFFLYNYIISNENIIFSNQVFNLNQWLIITNEYDFFLAPFKLFTKWKKKKKILKISTHFRWQRIIQPLIVKCNKRNNILYFSFIFINFCFFKSTKGCWHSYHKKCRYLIKRMSVY